MTRSEIAVLGAHRKGAPVSEVETIITREISHLMDGGACILAGMARLILEQLGDAGCVTTAPPEAAPPAEEALAGMIDDLMASGVDRAAPLVRGILEQLHA